MRPTLLPGDYIWVQLFSYGVKLPFTNGYLIELEGPKRGDVVVFNFKDKPRMDFIKRVIGLPGDRVTIKGDEVYVNGNLLKSSPILIDGVDSKNYCLAKLSNKSKGIVPDYLKPFPYYRNYQSYQQKIEKLDNSQGYYIQYSLNQARSDDLTFDVPNDSYFMMGDNRDHSLDSRRYGVVPKNNIKGRATSIWLSVNRGPVRCRGLFGGGNRSSGYRWYRLGRTIF